MTTIDPLLEEFLDRPIRESTKRNYKMHLEKYQNSTGMSLTELIQEAESEEDDGIRPRKRKIKEHLKNYQRYLECEGHSSLSTKINLTTIRSFYRFFDIQLPTQRTKYKKEKIQTTTADLPGKEDIKKALQFSNLKYQALILTMSSSGMGASEVLSLTVKDLIKGTENLVINEYGLVDVNSSRMNLKRSNNNIIVWDVVRKKTGKQYTTFSTPEALDSILNYFESQSPSSPEDHIFRSRNNQPLKGKSVFEYFRKLNIRCGWDKLGRQAFMRSHHLRKYFANSMERTALGYLNSRRLMGHEIQDSTGAAYFKPDLNHLRFLYLQSMDAVMINWKTKVEVVTDEKIKQMEEEQKLLRVAIEQLRKQQRIND